MEKRISRSLERISTDLDIRILQACETGSRAWGFPSPDSDYDVRFIYSHSKDWYLSLDKNTDNVNLMEEEGLIDLSGWDLRKTLQLLSKSNVSVLERMQSKILYGGDAVFTKGLKEVAEHCFSPVKVMHHYLSMSKSFYAKINGKESVKLKDYFYALRAALAGGWIREMGGIPPLVFKEMFDLLKSEMKNQINELIELKSKMNEDYLHPADHNLTEFIRNIISKNEAVTKSLEVSKPDRDHLNTFFLKWIK